MNYEEFIADLDKRLEGYFVAHKEFIHCKLGCSMCCEKGDYPLSKIELEYLMQGFINLDNEIKIKVQNNIKNIVRGGACPFLINKQCSVYPYRPIICRVHGLAYICKESTDGTGTDMKHTTIPSVVKVPYCVNNGKNYADVYGDGEITINPVLENLDTQNLLKDFEYGEIRNLTDWI